MGLIMPSAKGRQPKMKTTTSERFWKKVDKLPDPIEVAPEAPEWTHYSCWIWKAKLWQGYGRFKFCGKDLRAHRYAYETLKEPILAGLVLDHLCRNPCCVNPAHLEPVTQRTNILRGVGLAAQQVMQTHCKRGHELSGDNLIAHKLRRRIRGCMTCKMAQQNIRRRLRAKRSIHLGREIWGGVAWVEMQIVNQI